MRKRGRRAEVAKRQYLRLQDFWSGCAKVVPVAQTIVERISKEVVETVVEYSLVRVISMECSRVAIDRKEFQQ